MLTRADVKKSLVKEYHVFKSKIISKMLLEKHVNEDKLHERKEQRQL